MFDNSFEDAKKEHPNDSDDIIKCRFDVYENEKFFTKMPLFAFLSELNLSDEQKAFERVKFFKFMGKILIKLITCEQKE